MLHWTQLVTNPRVMASIILFCLSAIFAATAWLRKRRWMFHVAVLIALVGWAAGFVLPHFKDRNAAPSTQPKIAFQESKATAQLQPASQVAVAPSPSKPEPPFPEPVKPEASNSRAPSLWVVSNGGEVTEYDASTFKAKQTLKIPPDAIPSDARTFRYLVDMNRRGQILVGPTSHGNSGTGTTCILWLWNGQSGSISTVGTNTTKKRRRTANIF